MAFSMCLSGCRGLLILPIIDGPLTRVKRSGRRDYIEWAARNIDNRKTRTAVAEKPPWED